MRSTSMSKLGVDAIRHAICGGPGYSAGHGISKNRSVK